MQAATTTEIASRLSEELRPQPFYPLIEEIDIIPALSECGWGARIEGRLSPDHRRWSLWLNACCNFSSSKPGLSDNDILGARSTQSLTLSLSFFPA